MGRSLALEYAECWGGLIDLDPDDLDGGAAALAAELLDGDGEDQVALREPGALRPSLVRRKRTGRRITGRRSCGPRART